MNDERKLLEGLKPCPRCHSTEHLHIEIVDDYLPDELSAKVCCTECRIFAQQWGMFKAIQDFAGVLPIGFILAVLVFLMRKALKAEGDEAFGYDKTVVVATLGIFALVTPVVFGCFAMDAITHLAVPQVAMINDMLEMVQNG